MTPTKPPMTKAECGCSLTEIQTSSHDCEWCKKGAAVHHHHAEKPPMTVRGAREKAHAACYGCSGRWLDTMSGGWGTKRGSVPRRCHDNHVSLDTAIRALELAVRRGGHTANCWCHDGPNAPHPKRPAFIGPAGEEKDCRNHEHPHTDPRCVAYREGADA
jgi:hypothetical protein